jgi:hypothetical protein
MRIAPSPPGLNNLQQAYRNIERSAVRVADAASLDGNPKALATELATLRQQQTLFNASGKAFSAYSSSLGSLLDIIA